MFKTAKLSKVIITGSKDHLEDTITILHDKSIIHIKDFTEEKGGLTIGEALPEASDLSKKMVRVKSIMSSLDMEMVQPEKKEHVDAIEGWVNKTLGPVENAVIEHSQSKNATESRIEELKRQEELISQLDPLPQDLRLDVKSVASFTGKLKKAPSEALGKYFKVCTVHEAKEHKEWLVVIHAPLAHEKRVEELLEIAEFTPMELPTFSGSISETKKNIAKEKKDLDAKLIKADEMLAQFRDKHGKMLLAAEEMLSNKLDRAEIPLHIATTKEFFIIEGWVPSKRLEEVTIAIPKGTDNGVSVEVLEEKDDDTPVLMKNSAPTRPFQTLVEAYSTPKAKEIDPTSIVALFFPIFFGFMLGDIGYGIVIICLVASGLTRKMFKMFAMEGATPHLNKILVYSSVSSIIFGFLYGEFFGFMMYSAPIGASHQFTGFMFPNIHYGDYHVATILFGLQFNLPLDRLAPEGITLLIVLSAMIGIFHLYLAWFLGFRNKAVLDGFKHAFLEKGGWLLTLTGGWMLCIILVPVIMKGDAFELFSLMPMLAIALLAVGMMIAVVGEGPTSLVELPTMLLSNTLSYTRLFAIGASSAGIAMAFNNMAGEQWDAGGTGIIMGALIFFMGHFINVILGLIGPTLHSLRLQYVEFFTKFYEGGGNRYQPFGKRRRYTIEN